MEQVLASKKILTIISASNRPHQLQGFLDNLEEMLAEPSAIEFLIKIDDGDDTMKVLLDAAIKKYSYAIRYIQTPRLDGYYTLHYGYQELFELSDPATYFILPINEEVRFTTKGFEQNLRKYIKLFPDDIFRLKISQLKLRNYYSYHDCGPCPENYPILTRRWLELAEGIGDCWGPDGWHQFLDYHLGVVTTEKQIVPGAFRSVPILDINLSNEEAGRELTKQQSRVRDRRVCEEWWRMYSPALQQKFRRLATKMYVHIWASNAGLNDFTIVEKKEKYIFYLLHNGKLVQHFYYYLSPTYIRCKNLGFLLKKSRQDSIGFLKAYIFPAKMPANIFLRYSDRCLRIAIVMAIFALSYITVGFESCPYNLTTRFKMRIKDLLYKSTKKSLGEKNAQMIKNAYKKVRKSSAF